MKIISGIYEIVNMENGRRYIGSSCDIHNRLRHHKASLNNNKHPNQYLQYSWNKYGGECFSFSVLEQCEADKKKLFELEQHYINQLEPEYNIAHVAGSCLGTKRTDETRKRVSIAQKNRPYFTGHKHTQEYKIMMSKLVKGRILSEETKDKISASRKALFLKRKVQTA